MTLTFWVHATPVPLYGQFLKSCFWLFLSTLPFVSLDMCQITVKYNSIVLPAHYGQQVPGSKTTRKRTALQGYAIALSILSKVPVTQYQIALIPDCECIGLIFISPQNWSDFHTMVRI